MPSNSIQAISSAFCIASFSAKKGVPFLYGFNGITDENVSAFALILITINKPYVLTLDLS